MVYYGEEHKSDIFPPKIVIIDEGGIWRSTMALQMLSISIQKKIKELEKNIGYRILNSQYPILRSCGFWRKEPKLDNVTKYPLWEEDRERFEELVKKFGGGGGDDAESKQRGEDFLASLYSKKKEKVSEEILANASSVYVFTNEDLKYFKKEFPDYANIVYRFDSLTELPELPVEDHSTRLNYDTALESLETIQKICNNRVRDIFSNEMEVPKENIKIA